MVKVTDWLSEWKLITVTQADEPKQDTVSLRKKKKKKLVGKYTGQKHQEKSWQMADIEHTVEESLLKGTYH